MFFIYYVGNIDTCLTNLWTMTEQPNMACTYIGQWFKLTVGLNGVLGGETMGLAGGRPFVTSNVVRTPNDRFHSISIYVFFTARNYF